MQHYLYMYCGQACCLKTSYNSKSVSSRTQINHSSSFIKIPVKISISGKTITTYALLDSGAACNFTLTSSNSHLAVEELDGHPIGEGRVAHITEEVHMQVGILHKEIIRFYVIHQPNNLVIPGLPWLRRYNPHISWKEGEGQKLSWSMFDSSFSFTCTFYYCQRNECWHPQSTCRIFRPGRCLQ